MEQRFTNPAPSLEKTLVDIFASPSDAFEAMKDSIPSRSLWLVPMVCTYLLFVSQTCIVFTDNVLKTELMEHQITLLHHKVNDGKLTKAEADKVEAGMYSQGDLMMVFSITGGIILIPLFYFGCALLLWLASTFIFKSSLLFIKFLELFGMTTWIGLLGRIFTIALITAFGTSTATPSAALVILGSYDSSNIFHRILTGVNIFTIWEVILVGIGLGTISGKSSSAGIFISFGLWIFLMGSLILLGFGR